jgi:hypothetical protein
MNKLQNKVFASCLLNLCEEAKNDDEIKYVLGVLHAQANGKTFNLLTDCIEELSKLGSPQQLEVVNTLQTHLLNLKPEVVAPAYSKEVFRLEKTSPKKPKTPGTSSPTELYANALKELPAELQGLSIVELCKKYGINEHSFRSRVRRGISAVDALTRPIGNTAHKKFTKKEKP